MGTWLLLRRSVWAAGFALVVIGLDVPAELGAVIKGEDGVFWIAWMGALLSGAIITFNSLRAPSRALTA